MSEIELVDEFPLPFDQEEVVDMQVQEVGEPYGLPFYSDVTTSVDEFHDRYIEELHENDEWVFFKNHWNDSGYIYVWCREGYGFKFEGDWEVACSFVDAWDGFTDEYSPEDFEPPRHPWEVP